MDNNYFMLLALKEAKKALKNENIPVGAIIVKNNTVIAKAYNKRHVCRIATHHAEILAIEKACRKLGDWRLNGCKMYVTLEPCEMCMGAIKESRIDKVIVGARRKTDSSIHVTVEHDCLSNKCSQELLDFFEQIRK